MIEDLQDLMQEPPGGENYGAVATSYTDDDGGVRVAKSPLGPGFSRLERGRYGVASGKQDGGLVAHRGVVSEDEYVDADALRLKVEAGLGFTYDQIRSVYRQGPLSPDQRQLRDKIDARLLALSRSGGNMLALAKILGWGIEAADEDGGERCKTMERAVARARAAA